MGNLGIYVDGNEAHGPHRSQEKQFQPINTYAQIYDYIMKLIKKKYHDHVHLFLLFNYIFPLKGQDCSFEQT